MPKTQLLPLLLVTLLAACGKSEEPRPAAGAATASVATPAAPAAAPAAPAQTAPPAAQPPVPTPTPATPPATPAAAAAGTPDGAAVYKKVCGLCHSSGAAGAPKLGDKAQWEKRIAQGKDVLYTHAFKGFTGKSGMMPAKGGNLSLSDDEVRAAVDYMAAAAK